MSRAAFKTLAVVAFVVLSAAVGGNNAGHRVAWWVGVGGSVGNAIGTYSEAGGWNHVMNISINTWNGVTLEIYPSSHTYDITVWEEATPANSAAAADPEVNFRGIMGGFNQDVLIRD